MKKVFWFLAYLFLLLAACESAATQIPEATVISDETRIVTVMTHDSFSISDDVLNVFEKDNNVTVQFLMAGSTSTAVNKAVLAVGNPLADVFYGVDNTFLSRALDEGIFESYASPLLAEACG